MSGVVLSACMIVRNESALLRDCLLSLEGVADETIVVDTGSTDGTLETCREHGVDLHHYAWDEDFSAARNESLKHARGEWILLIDADESLRSCRTDHLKRMLDDPSKVGYHALLHSLTGWTPAWALRLFRKDPRIRFQGIIHETIWDGIQEVVSADGAQIGQSELVIDHVGYEGNQNAKHRRNLPLLLRELAREPGRTNNRRHLALIYYELGDTPLAEETWSGLIRSLKAKEDLQPIDSLPFVDLIQLLMETGRDAGALIEDGLELFPENPHFHWLKGRHLMNAGRYEEAMPFFERLLLWGRRKDFDHAISYDARIFGRFSHDSLATCAFRLGDYARSMRYLEFAEELTPGKIEYKTKRALCSILARTQPPCQPEAQLLRS